MVESIQRTIEELRAAVPQAGVAAPAISQWSVGMHVHHCCLSMIGISKTLRKSTPPRPRTPPSLARSIVLKLGYIPRGRAQSPSIVVPSASVEVETLITLLDESITHIRDAKTLDPGQWFTHPLLGSMERDGALKFVLVHNRHHLRIITDILASRT